MENKEPEKIIDERVEDLYAQVGATPIRYPPGFKPDCNITYKGKDGVAKLTLPALGEIMKQLGTKPRIFTMPIEAKSMGPDCPLVNTIYMSPDIAAAIEEHMITKKEKNSATEKNVDSQS